MLTPAFTYTSVGLQPLYDNDWGMDNVALLGGVTYPQGQVLGLVPGTGTPVNEVQTITITGAPTGGTFTLIFGGSVIIGPIPYNATAAAVATAVNAVLGAGTVTGGGGALPGTPVTLTFGGDAAGMAMAAMVASAAFSGGTAPAIAVTRSTPGMPAGGYFKAYDDTASDGSQVARRILKFQSYVNQFGNVTYGGIDMAAFGGAANRANPAYYKGYFKTSWLTGLDAAGVVDLGKLTNATLITDPNAILCVTGA